MKDKPVGYRIKTDHDKFTPEFQWEDGYDSYWQTHDTNLYFNTYSEAVQYLRYHKARYESVIVYDYPFGKGE